MFKIFSVYGIQENEKTSRTFSDSSSLKSVFEKLRFRDGIVWTEDNNEINNRNKAMFSNLCGVL